MVTSPSSYFVLKCLNICGHKVWRWIVARAHMHHRQSQSLENSTNVIVSEKFVSFVSGQRTHKLSTD